jgi:spoIIIJ-associated protein
MKKIEATTLEEAYAKAADAFDCSIMDLDYEIVQRPSGGFLGFGAKKAIIVAVCKRPAPSNDPTPPTQTQTQTSTPAPRENRPSAPKSHQSSAVPPKPEAKKTPAITPQKKSHQPKVDPVETDIINDFFDDTPKKQTKGSAVETPIRPDTKHPDVSDAELGHTIENRLGELVRSACFDIDTVEVDVIDGTAYIFIDGEDAALLIGKEGYRYNALSYMLYNWIRNEYDLYVKLEIAQFLASQQEMIRNYIQPVIEHVNQKGWGKTRLLDGILVQIALEQLRDQFPNKYVAIKRTRNGERYILVNEFNKRT